MNTRIVRLGSVCTVVSGSTPKSEVAEYWDGDIKWITPAELTEDSYIITDTVRHITSQAVHDTSLKPFPEGTVILSSRAPIGKTAIAGCEMYCNQGFKNLICSPRIDPKYLYYFLTGKTEYLNSLGRGATFKEISKSIVENIEIPLPELAVQRQISLQFEHIRALIKQCRDQLHYLDQLVKSRFIEMFGDPATNPFNHPVRLLSDVAEYYNGLTYKPEDVSETGTVVLRSSNIQNSALDFADTVRVVCPVKQRMYVQDKDILMCSRNGSAKLVGKVALIHNLPEKMSFGAFMMIIRSQYSPYLFTYFQMDAFREQIRTGATTTINQITGKMLDGITLPVPPMEEIAVFADFVAQTDKSKYSFEREVAA